MNVYVIYSLSGETVDTAFKIEGVAFSEDAAKAETMRLMAEACRTRSLANLTGAYCDYVTYHYEAVKTLDELGVVKDHVMQVG